MSVITPTLSATSDVALSHDRASSTPPRPTFQRPVAPEPDPARDNELLSLYFDGTWTTKDIADHFKLPVAVIAAWFQRSDIAALIDFVAAANERRARDIAREGLPGTIDILHRISRTRNSDKVACAASNALIRFSRGQASAAFAGSTVSLRMGADLGEVASVFARAGAISWTNSIESRFDIPGQPAIRRELSDSGVGMTLGAGFNFRLSDCWRMQIEGQHCTLGEDEVNMVTLGLSLDFGTFIEELQDEL